MADQGAIHFPALVGGVDGERRQRCARHETGIVSTASREIQDMADSRLVGPAEGGLDHPAHGEAVAGALIAEGKARGRGDGHVHGAAASGRREARTRRTA